MRWTEVKDLKDLMELTWLTFFIFSPHEFCEFLFFRYQFCLSICLQSDEKFKSCNVLTISKFRDFGSCTTMLCFSAGSPSDGEETIICTHTHTRTYTHTRTAHALFSFCGWYDNCFHGDGATGLCGSHLSAAGPAGLDGWSSLSREVFASLAQGIRQRRKHMFTCPNYTSPPAGLKPHSCRAQVLQLYLENERKES